MPKLEIESNYCKGCKLCILACPKKVLKIGEKINEMGYRFIIVDKSEECIGCKMCATVCPESAIEIYK